MQLTGEYSTRIESSPRRGSPLPFTGRIPTRTGQVRIIEFAPRGERVLTRIGTKCKTKYTVPELVGSR